MPIEVVRTPIEGLFVIKPKVFGDLRGYFLESYNKEEWESLGLSMSFVQDNQSLSRKGALRGMHFQHPPFAQGKLVRVIKGAVLDVVVDIRRSSPTYGQSFSLELSDDNFLQLYIPPGFAHGFLTLSEEAVFTYKCTDYYRPEHEGGLAWNDRAFAIEWGIEDPILSEKDRNYAPFSVFQSPF